MWSVTLWPPKWLGVARFIPNFSISQLFPPDLINDLLFTVESLLSSSQPTLAWPQSISISQYNWEVRGSDNNNNSSRGRLRQPLNIIISCIQPSPAQPRPGVKITLNSCSRRPQKLISRTSWGLNLIRSAGDLSGWRPSQAIKADRSCSEVWRVTNYPKEFVWDHVLAD